MEPEMAKVSPFPEGRDLGRGQRARKKCVGLKAFERVITLKYALTLSKFDNLRNLDLYA